MQFSRIAIAAGFTTTAVAFPLVTYGVFGLKPAPAPGISTMPSRSNATTTTNSTGLQWVGVNESGADFGTVIPVTTPKDYEWPNNTSIDVLAGKGLNIFRIPFLMERLAQTEMTAPLDPTYLAGLKGVISHITAAKNYAVVDAHNYGRYPWDNNNGPVINFTSDFKAFWKNVAEEFATDSNVIFDFNNEYNNLNPDHNKELEILTGLNQACIDGVRAAGATTQYIFVEGTGYTSALHWVDSGSGDALLGLKDPSDKIVYEVHQYLDDGSGKSADCISSTIGQERIANATQWLKTNKKKGVLGEFAGGDNPTCKTAITGMLEDMVAAKDVWMGAIWWGGGAMWDDGSVKDKPEYVYRMEPPNGVAYKAYADTLANYVSK